MGDMSIKPRVYNCIRAVCRSSALPQNASRRADTGAQLYGNRSLKILFFCYDSRLTGIWLKLQRKISSVTLKIGTVNMLTYSNCFSTPPQVLWTPSLSWNFCRSKHFWFWQQLKQHPGEGTIPAILALLKYCLSAIWDISSYSRTRKHWKHCCSLICLRLPTQFWAQSTLDKQPICLANLNPGRYTQASPEIIISIIQQNFVK